VRRQVFARLIVVASLALASIYWPHAGLAGELFPYNPPNVSSSRQVEPRRDAPSVPDSRFYDEFREKVKKLRPDEKARLRSRLYEEVRKASNSGDAARESYYRRLIQNAGL
jgi:hypothetical protein